MCSPECETDRRNAPRWETRPCSRQSFINPGKVFDPAVPLADVALGYKAMDKPGPSRHCSGCEEQAMKKKQFIAATSTPATIKTFR